MSRIITGKRKTTIKALLFTLIAVTVSILATTESISAQTQPTISISPKNLVTGRSYDIVVTGANFTAGETLSIEYLLKDRHDAGIGGDTSIVGNTTVDNNGRFIITVNIPSIPSTDVNEPVSFYMMAFPISWPRSAENVRQAPKDVFVVANPAGLPPTGKGVSVDASLNRNQLLITLVLIGVSSITLWMIAEYQRRNKPTR